MLLASTSDLVEITTSGSQVTNVHAHADDLISYGSSVQPYRLNTIISSATTTTIVASPASSVQRQINHITITNQDASVTNTITVKHTDGSSVITAFSVALPAGALMEWTKARGWMVYSAAGSQQVGVVGPIGATGATGATGAGAAGAVIAISTALGTGASYSSVNTIPINAIVYMAVLTVSVAYSAGTTIELGISGTPADFMTTAQNTPSVTGTYMMPQYTIVGSTASLLATISGSPASGTATMSVLYGMPLS